MKIDESRLKAMEDQLRAKLRAFLPDASKNGTLIFENSEFNAHNLPIHHLSTKAEELLALSRRCMTIRERTGLETAGSIGHLYIEACRELADLKNPHRRGPRRLAAWLLAKL